MDGWMDGWEGVMMSRERWERFDGRCSGKKHSLRRKYMQIEAGGIMGGRRM